MRGWRTELPRRHREGKNRRRLAPVVDPRALSVTMASSALVMTMDDGEAGSVALVATTTKTPSGDAATTSTPTRSMDWSFSRTTGR